MLSSPGAAEHAIASSRAPRPSAPAASIPASSRRIRGKRPAAVQIHPLGRAGAGDCETQCHLASSGSAKGATASATRIGSACRPAARPWLPSPYQIELPSSLLKEDPPAGALTRGLTKGGQVSRQSVLRPDRQGVLQSGFPAFLKTSPRPECSSAVQDLKRRVMDGVARAEVEQTPAATSVPQAAMAACSLADDTYPRDRLGQNSASIGLAGTREQTDGRQTPSVERLPFAPLGERKQTAEQRLRHSARAKDARPEALLANAAQARHVPPTLQTPSNSSEQPAFAPATSGAAHRATSEATHSWGKSEKASSAAPTGQPSETANRVADAGPDREAAEGMALPEGLDHARLPRHVAMILDGNSRWAERRRLPKEMGHEAGVQALKRTVRLTGRWGIPALTVFAFSTENWNRPKAEVDFLMTLLERLLDNDIAELHRENVVVQVMGDVAQLSPGLQKKIQSAWTLTQHNKGLKLSIAVNYSGRQDIVHACRQLAARVAAGELAPEDISEDMIDASLGTGWLGPGLGSPDLLIRTSGEQRLSNFLLWQSAYTELVFCPCLWPDFDQQRYAEALQDYQRRERRFGGRK